MAWVPPYQQLNSKDWQTYHHNISTTEALQPVGAAIQMGFAQTEDEFADRVRASVKAKLLKSGFVTPDAMAQLGVERQIPRGPNDSDATYESRLWNAWNTWPFAGTAFGLLTALYEAGYQNVIIAQSRGGRFFTLDNGGTNLVNASQDLIGWNPNGLTKALGAGTAPDGTPSAISLNEGVTNAIHQINSTGVPAEVLGEIRRWSAWLKNVNLPNVAIREPGNTGRGVNFNLTTGVIDSLAQSTTILASGVQTFSFAPGWFRVYFAATEGATGTNMFIAGCADNTYATGATYLGTSRGFLLWNPQVELGFGTDGSPGPVTQTVPGFNKPTALAAGSLLTSTALNGLWSTDVLSAYSPPDQSFWSKFDVIFPLPLQAPSFSWSGGIPSSSSAEANFIRALIQAWKPAHATCNKIIFQQLGNLWGYPATNKWGAATGTWGNTSNTVWTP